MSKRVQEFSPTEKLTVDEFKKYLQIVRELNAIASGIEEWHSRNVLSVVGMPRVEEARVQYGKLSEEVKKIVVSGLRVEQYKQPYYVDNAYAMFAKDFLGIQLENPVALTEKLSFGEDVSDVGVMFRRVEFLEFVSKVREVTSFILKKARELGVGVELPKPVEKPVHELIEEFVQKAYEVTVGVNEFATAVWGLRKIMPSYMKKVYGDTPQQLLTSLGFDKLLEVKHAKLWGFEDYATRLAVYCMGYAIVSNIPTPYGLYREVSGVYTTYAIVNNIPTPSRFIDSLHREVSDNTKRQRILKQVEQWHSLTTLGGAICSLNQVVWSYNRKLSDVLNKWFSEYVDLEHEYVREALKKLGELRWTTPQYLHYSQIHDITSDYFEFRAGFVYDESGVVEHVILREGDACTCRYREQSEIGLIARVLYDLAPAMLLGVSDVTLRLRLYGARSRDDLCGNVSYSDVSKYEDVNAIVVLSRRAW